jgi:hypothetical protein
MRHEARAAVRVARDVIADPGAIPKSGRIGNAATPPPEPSSKLLLTTFTSSSTFDEMMPSS